MIVNISISLFLDEELPLFQILELSPGSLSLCMSRGDRILIDLPKNLIIHEIGCIRINLIAIPISFDNFRVGSYIFLTTPQFLMIIFFFFYLLFDILLFGVILFTSLMMMMKTRTVFDFVCEARLAIFPEEL